MQVPKHSLAIWKLWFAYDYIKIKFIYAKMTMPNAYAIVILKQPYIIEPCDQL